MIEAVCALCKGQKSDLLLSPRGVGKRPRDLPFYLLQRHNRKTLTETGAVFGIENYSAARVQKYGSEASEKPKALST